MGNDGELAEMGQERDRAARGTIGIKGGVCRVGSWVIRCPGAASVASRGGAADEDRISRGVEAGRSVPGGVYGRMFGACGSRIVRNRAVSPRVQRFRGLRRFPD